jgi:hypothetical protein
MSALYGTLHILRYRASVLQHVYLPYTEYCFRDTDNQTLKSTSLVCESERAYLRLH